MKLNTQNAYMVPRWCRMHITDHFDGMGGCWGVSSGLVAEQGRDYCRTCAFYRRIAERMDPFDAMGELMKTEERHRGQFQLSTQR